MKIDPSDVVIVTAVGVAGHCGLNARNVPPPALRIVDDASPRRARLYQSSSRSIVSERSWSATSRVWYVHRPPDFSAWT